jgi:hypothetical protein
MTLRPIEQLAARYAAERDASLAGAAAQRRAAGIVHTPPELARAVVRVADELLRSRLGVGLGDPEVLVVDPACGPGAFLAAVLALAEERAGAEPPQQREAAEGGGGADAAKRASSAPPAGARWLGFDVDEASLSWAARLREHSRGAGLELIRADVLEGDAIADRVRQNQGPLVVLGNPPWATVRAQPSPRDQARLADFRRDVQDERKLGVLSDAYVRFFALCAELARDSEAGALVALVTNASFLDGPVHRGMRARLLEWFDELAVLDLGGSALLGQQRAQRDDNVFGVRPNVAISWLCRYPRPRRGVLGRASYARSFGSRAQKLARLEHATLDSLALAPHACEPPAYGFVPRPPRDASYSRWLSLDAWLPFHREGVQSNRDALVVDTNPDRLLDRLQAFCRGEQRPELAAAYRALHHYDPARARAALTEALAREPASILQRIAYRPWDERVFCAVAPLCHRPRPLLQAALAHGGIALLSVRKDRGDMPWRHVSASAAIVDNCYLSARSSCRTRAFPSFTPEGAPNIGPHAGEQLAAVGCEGASSLDVQHYLLCVLSAASYQACWDSELHHDYARIPAPRDAASFAQLAALGARLAALHASPCETRGCDDVPAQGARFKDLELARGQLRLNARVLFQLPEAALALRVGQLQPLAAYIAQRAGLPLRAADLRAVCARAERLVALSQLIEAVNVAVIESFGRFRRQ